MAEVRSISAAQLQHTTTTRHPWRSSGDRLAVTPQPMAALPFPIRCLERRERCLIRVSSSFRQSSHSNAIVRGGIMLLRIAAVLLGIAVVLCYAEDQKPEVKHVSTPS